MTPVIVFLRRMLFCEFGNSEIALLSNEDNDSEVLSIGGDSFPEISFVTCVEKKTARGFPPLTRLLGERCAKDDSSARPA